MIEAVVFDLDDTLINLPIDYEKLFEKFRKIMKTNDIQPITKKASVLDAETKTRVFEVWDSAEEDARKNLTINDEGMNLYRKHSAKPKALVTMQGKTLTLNILTPLELSFDFIVTRENSLDRRKQLALAIKKLGSQTRNILFVGNTEDDAQAAKQIGCQFHEVKT